jgi:2-methylcitrate dehydratase PrpD
MTTTENKEPESREDAGRVLARHAATLRFESLPVHVIELTKYCILDTLGTTLAATTLAPQSTMLHDYVRELGGAAQSTLIGYREKAPAQLAAFLNGANSHLLDYDDVGSGHVAVATVPVALAMVDKIGGISGRELLTAIAAGSDIHARLFCYDTIEQWILNHRFSSTQALGYLSGAAVAGRIAKLNAEQMSNAMGLAYQQLAGAEQPHLMQAGWCCQSAVQAALLAQRGVAGVNDIVDGRNGLLAVYLRGLNPDYRKLLGELGTRFPMLDYHGFKAWPACGSNLRPVNCILDLRREHGLRPEDIAAITVRGGPLIQRLAEPASTKLKPSTGDEAKTSLQFTCAVAMVHGDVRLSHYAADGLKDPTVLALARRVQAEKADVRVPSVEIRLHDGRVYHEEVVHPLGDDRRNPMSKRQLEDKFRDCAAYAAKPVSKANVESIIELVADLENVPDAGEITRLL